MKDKIRVLVVDDEELARERLIRLVNATDNYQVCAEASNGEEALTAIQQSDPAIVLMDIRMPGMDGLAAAEQVATLATPPAIIFCTAYDEYAISAFKVQATDYLLKPVRKEALEKALQQAGKLNKVQLSEGSPISRNNQTTPYLVAKTWKGRELIDLTHIYYFMADQKYVTVHHQNGETVIDNTLKELEADYAPRFLRTHRNSLVNTVYIEALIRDNAGHYNVRLKNNAGEIPVSRRHTVDVKAWIESQM
ncbi:LytR/AlgR family response regulator transcription factor [Alkalimarinus alittae]|uniref:LytTR family DNA-binding domain-containing protein n=1 Tax=Alkalimarinus alittae TaxID=2961619 RepID=A0ABY6N300_9ALTE|nr:LytTR family DNA-binding domain-containing protein [Alkalimarinus alittae]UZE96453.1 LytTR family DNA-binding domain-containing protein [Alkalimarinus alittae]